METLRGFSFIADYRYIGVFCVFFLYATGCASIIPGRSTMIALGVICHLGLLNLYLAALTALVASIAGANVGYAIGKYTLGSVLSRRERFLFLSRSTIVRGTAIARQHGAKLIIPAMFVGGFWALTSLIPGVVRMKHSRFAVVNGLGLILWVSVLMSMGYFGGYVWSKALVDRSYIILFLVVVLIALLIGWRIAARKLRQRVE